MCRWPMRGGRNPYHDSRCVVNGPCRSWSLWSDYLKARFHARYFHRTVFERVAFYSMGCALERLGYSTANIG